MNLEVIDDTIIFAISILVNEIILNHLKVEIAHVIHL